MWSLLVWEQQGDWSAAQHYEGGGGLGGVKPEGAPGDEADGRVSTLDAAVGQAKADGGLDAVAVGAAAWRSERSSGLRSSAQRAPLKRCATAGSVVASSWRQWPRRTVLRASVPIFTTWKGSQQITAWGACPSLATDLG